MKREDGFTLIEIIAVLVIFAVIASFIIIKFNSFNNRAESTTQRFEEKANERIDWYEKLMKDGKKGIEEKGE